MKVLSSYSRTLKLQVVVATQGANGKLAAVLVLIPT